MRKILLAIVAILLFNNCCTDPLSKSKPEYKGVDDRAKRYVDEYLELSRQNNMHFKGTVTLGFKKINHEEVIGVCNNGDSFREIDLDLTYWSFATERSKLALAFHELTHCYCERGHDWGKDQMYPETEAKRIEQALEWRKNGGPRPGYWTDGCPISLMYPVVVDDDCMMEHYNEYVTEMFDRCKSW